MRRVKKKSCRKMTALVGTAKPEGGPSDVADPQRGGRENVVESKEKESFT